MTTIPFPNLDFDAAWSRLVPAQSNRSGWTGKAKAVRLPGASLWRCDITFEPIATELEERALRVFVEGLDGIVNATDIPRACQQHIGPKPLVAAGATSGSTLPLDGMTPSTTILRAGQFMTVPLPSGHQRLVMLTADLATNLSGEATATFKPDLGEVPAENATVETVKPFSRMKSTINEIPLPTADGVTLVRIAFEEDR